jgi:hypothetical protein
MSRIFPITSLIDKLTEYIKVKGEMLKLEIMSQVAKILSYAITFLVVALIMLFLVFFAGLTLAVYLNDVLSSAYLGYLIVSGIILFSLIIILLLLRSGKIQRWLESLLINIGRND